MIKLTIDERAVEVPEGSTVLQAAQQLGIEVPIFCYHERLSIAGNCRMCLVQMGDSPKPIASCAMPASEGMVIHTNTPLVEKARKGVLEFLLINHPLDCPICDQGGECDLQDITMAYGREKSRFHFYKRAVLNKDLGPLVKTEMTRCIHCTRCVRFASEVAGVPEMGAIYRGEHTEITSYLEKALTSELSGNIIDLCPVGALTSKPYAFTGRSWELVKTESIDVLDALGSNIRVDSRGREVMRILPRLNEEVNEEWLSDKSRFSYDGLKYQRLDRPYVRDETGKLVPATWDEAFDRAVRHLKSLKSSQIAGIVGDLMDAEAMGMLKEIMAKLKSPHIDCRQDGVLLGAGPRCSYLFNTTLAGVEQADFCLLIGTNPRVEAPVLNARLRKTYVAKGLPVASIGPAVDLTYPVTFYENNPALLQKMLAAKSHPLKKAFQAASHPLLILGGAALTRPDSEAILHAARAFVEEANAVRPDWNGFNVLHTAASRVGGLDLGLIPGRNGLDVAGILKGCATRDIQAVYLLGADEIDTTALKETFVIYQGHHGDRGAQVADVIFPGAAYTEKDGLYVNTEGRVQRGYMACTPPGEAREDWKILRMLAERLGLSLPINTLQDLRARLAQLNPLFQQVDTLVPAPWEEFGKKGEISAAGFVFSPPQQFYMTNAISRHSLTMAACTKARQEVLAERASA